MRIESNVGAGDDSERVHDMIVYPPVCRQVHGFFAGRFKSVSYRYGVGGLRFVVDGITVALMWTGGGSVSLVVEPTDGGVQFGESPNCHCYPSVDLPFNQDLIGRLGLFFGDLTRIGELTEKAMALSPPSREQVVAALVEHLGTSQVTFSYLPGNLLSGVELNFFAHRLSLRPSAGVLLCFGKGGKIEPFWNGSRKRRKLASGLDTLEMAVGRSSTDSISEMNYRVTAFAEFKKRLDEFDVSRSPVLVDLLNVKAAGDALLKEFKAIPAA